MPYGPYPGPSARDTGEAAPRTQQACQPAQVQPPAETARITDLLSSDSGARVGYRSQRRILPRTPVGKFYEPGGAAEPLYLAVALLAMMR
jgi:hypothetical protein